jgi:uncharacterized protein YaaW (UPF0174 family)
MNMGNDRTLSAEHQAKLASALVDAAVVQQDNIEKLLDQLKTAVDALDRGSRELTREMPNQIAKQAAKEVIQEIADSVSRKVADVLQPAEAKAQILLRAMEEAATTYRSAAWRCIFFACLAGSVSAVVVLVVLVKMLGIV